MLYLRLGCSAQEISSPWEEALMAMDLALAKESRLVVPRGKGIGWVAVWGFGCKLFIWNGWSVGPYCTAQGTVCDWVTFCTTEIEETL